MTLKQMQEEAFSHLYVHFQSILFGFFKTLVQLSLLLFRMCPEFSGSRIRANLAGSQEILGLKLCQTPFIANQTHITLSNLVFTEHQLHNVLGSVDTWMDKTTPLSRLIFWWWCKKSPRDFPSGPVVKILCFHFRGAGFDPSSWN